MALLILLKLNKRDKISVLAVQSIQTWQAGTALHSVRVLPLTQPADVEAQRLNVIDALRHHQVLVHQVASVRAGLGQKQGFRTHLQKHFY